MLESVTGVAYVAPNVHLMPVHASSQDVASFDTPIFPADRQIFASSASAAPTHTPNSAPSIVSGIIMTLVVDAGFTGDDGGCSSACAVARGIINSILCYSKCRRASDK